MTKTKQLTNTLLISSLSLMSAYGYAGEKVSGTDDQAITMCELGTMIFGNSNTGASWTIFAGMDQAYNGNGVSNNATGLDDIGYTGASLRYLSPGSIPNLTFNAEATLDEKGNKSGHLGLGYGVTTSFGTFGVAAALSDSDRNAADGDKKDGTTVGVGYNYGPVSVSVAREDYTAENKSNTDVDSTTWGLKYKVYNNVKIFLVQSTKDYDSSSVDEKQRILGVSYTMGSINLKAGYFDVKNIAGTSGQDDDALAFNLSYNFSA